MVLDHLDGAKYTVAELFDRAVYNHPAQSSLLGGGTYEIPYMGNLVAVYVTQFVVCYVLCLYLVKVLGQNSYVGLPWSFPLSK